jgi:filamentous hemagglutinin family protein
MKKNLTLSLALFTATVFANPTSPVVKNGDVTIDCHDNLVKITASDKSIIQWENFSIDAGEIARFIQPNSSATVLNKVTGLTPSMINGVLEANGRVVLVNPHGVIIGKDGVINAADFIASTTDLLDLNDWSIKRDSGTLAFEGSGSAMIQHRGVIQASGFEKSNGRVLLVAPNVEVSGEILASQGTIELLGERIHLQNNSLINVSGIESGGIVLIGGDYRGNNRDIYNSQETIIDVGSLILANALENGNGGKVIVWSDTNTSFSGIIESKGGPIGGNGGFTEISSKGGWFFDGPVDLTAPFGTAGTLLLDPTVITISAGANSANVVPGANYSFAVAGTPANINNAGLVAQLGLANVVVDTLAAVDGGAPLGTGTLTVSAPISWNTANSLTLNADSSIFVNSPITATNGGSLSLNAFDSIFIASNISCTNGSVSAIAMGNNIFVGSSTATPSNITTTGPGTILLQAENNVIAAASPVAGGTCNISSATGNVTLKATVGSISLGSLTSRDVTHVSSTSGTIQLTSRQGINIIGGNAASADTTVFTSTVTAPIQVSVTGQGDLTINSTTAVAHAALGSDTGNCGSVTINLANGNIAMNSTASSNVFTDFACLIGSQDFVSINAKNMTMTATEIGGFRGSCGVIVNNPGALNTTTINLSGDFLMIAQVNLVPFGSPSTHIETINSNLNFACAGNFTIGNSSALVGPFPYTGIFTTTTGFTNIHVGGNASITGGNNSPIGETTFLNSAGSGPATIIVGGNIVMKNNLHTPSTIYANGPLTITAGGDFSLLGASNPTNGFSWIVNPGATGPINITAGGSIIMGPRAFITLASNDTATLIANKNIILNNATLIDSLAIGPNTKLTLVVDNQAPTSPNIGNGTFYLDPGALIFTSGSPGNPPVQIFTARPSQNTILGTIDNATFVPGPIGVNSSEEQWGFYYPQAFVGSPFTIFYKEPGLPPTGQILQAQAKFPVVLGSMYDVLGEFQYPLPIYRNYFTVDYQRKLWPSGRTRHADGFANKDEYPVQVLNYRKYHPYRVKFGIRQ